MFRKKLLSILFLIFTAVTFANETVKIQLLGTSDLHGKFMPYEYSTATENSKGSMVQLATLIKELRIQNPNTLLIDNGDLIQDNSHELFIKDKISPAVSFLNYMKYDAITLGNHEFNFGMESLHNVFKPFKGSILAANLYNSKGKRVFKPYSIFNKGGVKIAVIGVTTPHAVRWDADNLKGYTISNPVLEVAKVIKEIGNKADIFIVTAHMPEDTEYESSAGDSVREILEKNPEVLIGISGHAHALLNKNVSTGAVLIAPSKWGEHLAKIEFTATKKGNKWIVANRATDIEAENLPIKGYAPDSELVTLLKPFHERALADASMLIGELKGKALVGKEDINEEKMYSIKSDDSLVVALVREDDIRGIPVVQLEPTPMIQLINEVQMYYTKADISSVAAFRNDANIFEGPIKRSDVALIYKYDNTLRAYEMTGAQLKKYMEWSAEYYNQFKEGDLTISFNENVRGYNYDMFYGVNYDINIYKPVGERIENLTRPDGKPVKDSDIFVVAVNDYRGKTTLTAEKGGIFAPGEIKLVRDLFEEKGDAGRIRNLIGDYIVDVKKGVITPDVTPNWKLTGYSWDPFIHMRVKALVNRGFITLPKSADGRTSNVRAIREEDIKDFKDLNLNIE